MFVSVDDRFFDLDLAALLIPWSEHVYCWVLIDVDEYGLAKDGSSWVPTIWYGMTKLHQSSIHPVAAWGPLNLRREFEPPTRTFRTKLRHVTWHKTLQCYRPMLKTDLLCQKDCALLVMCPLHRVSWNDPWSKRSWSVDRRRWMTGKDGHGMTQNVNYLDFRW